VVAALAALSAVQGFIGGLLPQTLSYAGSQMRVGTFGQGVVFGAVELSALPALLALVLADRRGRRGVALGATAGAVAFSELSAASPAIGWLTGAQLVVGALLAAAGIAVTVIAVEEVPKGCRAWSLGILGLAAGFGAGVPLALLPLAGLGHGGWRWLYWSSLVCLPVVWRCAGQLPESRRWVAAAEAPARPWAASRRLALVCLGAALFALFATPAGQFETQFLRHERHYSAVAISVLEQLAGTVGALGVLFGGRLADTHGRRPVAAAAVAGATVATVAGYLARSGAMWAALTAAQFFLYATGPALGVYGAELFTTASRARSAGLVAAAAAVGGVLGTVATGGLDELTGHFGTALAVMAIGPVALVVLLLAAYPETAAVELEELSAEGTVFR
jgi:MFS family permease